MRNVTKITIADLKSDEGFRSTPYRCSAGVLSIGYGFNIDPDGSGGLTEEECTLILELRVQACTDDLVHLFGDNLWAQLDDVRQSALLNMRYQLGGRGLRKFEKMIAAVRLCSWVEAGLEVLDSRYAKQTPGRAQRVANMVAKGETQ